MSEELTFLNQDGTSQGGRKLQSLDPTYALVDERSLRDLLEFASGYAKKLAYFNEQNKLDGNWSDFLTDNLDELATALQNPDDSGGSNRPHLNLFLTFLELLQQAQAQLNTLTRRHLEFYYREALRLTTQPGRPDRVYLLAQLADQQPEYELPAGTLFQAGEDALGIPVFYRSDTDLFANQASVGSIKSLHATRTIIGLADVRQNPDLLLAFYPGDTDLTNPSLAERSFIAMLRLALGQPVSGGGLPYYPDNKTVNTAFLATLDSFLDFVTAKAKLSMSFASFRALMDLKKQQDDAPTTEWRAVNLYLQQIVRNRTKNASLSFDPKPADNFIANLQSALGVTAEYEDYFKTLPEVQDIYDLYQRCDQPEASESEFVKNRIYLEVNDFKAMMKIVETINMRWRQIYEILRAAAKKKASGANLPLINLREYNQDKFAYILQNTLGTLAYPTSVANLNKYLEKLIELENYFHLSAEEFVLLRQINAKQNTAQPWEWDQVYVILEKAHRNKIQQEQLTLLKQKRESDDFQKLLDFVFGNPLPENKIFADLDVFQDADYLRKILKLEPASFTYLRSIQRKEQTASGDEWQKVYQILESTMPKPLPQIEDWENLYAAQDAAQVQIDIDAGDSTPHWRAFGAVYTTPMDGQEAPTAPGAIGFALASPLLALSEGQRTITLTILFQQDGFDQVAINQSISHHPFEFLLTTEEGLNPVSPEDVTLQTLGGQQAIKITLTLDEKFPAVALTPEKDSPWPALYIMLADLPRAQGGPRKDYRIFENLSLQQIRLSVRVNALTQLALQNDEGLLDLNQPFEPFGSQPMAGTSFYFAHPELCSKELDALALQFEWMGLPPTGFSAHYKGYGGAPNDSEPITSDDVFKARLKLHDQGIVSKIGDIHLFGSADLTTAHVSAGELVTADEVLAWNRYWQLELGSPDFQHTLYPFAAAQAALASQPYAIKPPYTPKLKSFSVRYGASASLNVSTDVGEPQMALYHIEPFGSYPLTKSPYTFMPQFEDEGALFIGLDGLVPPQSLSLLFQMADGSANPDLTPTPVAWSYLDGNTWRSLEDGSLLSDGSDGLRHTGLVQFALPVAAQANRMPAGLYWLRASIPRNSDSVAAIVGIHPQAFSATYEDLENDPARLGQLLPPGSITALAERQPQIYAISQPYSSFGGKRQEQAVDFYIRASERLRHKNRALTSWDYERLALEAFPAIYKAKCLPVGSSPDPRLADTVQLIVIPDMRKKIPFDPFEPKFPADALDEIQAYLSSHSPPSPFVKLSVRNPTYLRLRLRVGVRLSADGQSNPGYARKRINDELTRYISPWAYDHSAEITFGGQVNTSLIVNFLENLPYVDYVAGLRFFTSPNGDVFTQRANDQPLPPDTVLVSDRAHEIDLIAEEAYQAQFFTGIGYMKIKFDFKVA